MRENPAEGRWAKVVSNRNRSTQRRERRKGSKETGKERRDLCSGKDEELALEIMSALYFTAICVFTIVACKHKENNQMWEMFPLFKCKLEDPKQSLI